MIKCRLKSGWISLLSMIMWLPYPDISARIFLVLEDDSVTQNALWAAIADLSAW
jgi:hypothetical protein